jgi:5'-deoxynucleotidase YfbR-like HD superfamily hydrolase
MYFSPELRTASVVPRWSIVWTLTRDVLSNHSFFVTLYAEQVARLIRWDGDRGRLMFMALTHDMDETISGDIVGPAKNAMLDTDKAKAYLDRNMLERLPYIVQQDAAFQSLDPNMYAEAKKIVKVADRLDALLYLVVEKRLGNSVIAPRIPECWASLQEAWYRLPCETSILDQMWDTMVTPAVKAHETTGGYGI